MKTILASLLMCLSMQSFAAVIFIRGQTAPLEYRNDLYFLPIGYDITPGTANMLVTMDGINKICFIGKAANKTLEQISEISIIIKGIKTDWNCFPYRTTLIEVRPW